MSKELKGSYNWELNASWNRLRLSDKIVINKEWLKVVWSWLMEFEMVWNVLSFGIVFDVI